MADSLAFKVSAGHLQVKLSDNPAKLSDEQSMYELLREDEARVSSEIWLRSMQKALADLMTKVGS